MPIARCTYCMLPPPRRLAWRDARLLVLWTSGYAMRYRVLQGSLTWGARWLAAQAPRWSERRGLRRSRP